MPDGGARSATLERMSAVSLTGVVRERNACADHSGFMPVVHTYRLAVASPLSFAYFSLRRRPEGSPCGTKKSRCRPAQGQRKQTNKKARKGQHRKSNNPNQAAAGPHLHSGNSAAPIR